MTFMLFAFVRVHVLTCLGVGRHIGVGKCMCMLRIRL